MRIGNDGFQWWVGQIEGTAADEENNKGGYRYKVAIVNHPQSNEILKTADLPWATVMMPVTTPFMPGNIGGAGASLVKGCWVIDFTWTMIGKNLSLWVLSEQLLDQHPH